MRWPGRRFGLAATMLVAAAQAPGAAPAGQHHLDLLCEPVYLPARSAWARSVRIVFDEQRIRALEIDGVPVHSFGVQGTVLITALDNERIRLDTAALSWASDFRGQASAQGRCARQD